MAKNFLNPEQNEAHFFAHTSPRCVVMARSFPQETSTIPLLHVQNPQTHGPSSSHESFPSFSSCARGPRPFRTLCLVTLHRADLILLSLFSPSPKLWRHRLSLPPPLCTALFPLPQVFATTSPRCGPAALRAPPSLKF